MGRNEEWKGTGKEWKWKGKGKRTDKNQKEEGKGA